MVSAKSFMSILAAGPFGRALFKKRRKAFAKIGSGADIGVLAHGDFKFSFQRGIVVAKEQALGAGDTRGTGGQENTREFLGAGSEGDCRNEFAYETELKGVASEGRRVMELLRAKASKSKPPPMPSVDELFAVNAAGAE